MSRPLTIDQLNLLQNLRPKVCSSEERRVTVRETERNKADVYRRVGCTPAGMDIIAGGRTAPVYGYHFCCTAAQFAEARQPGSGLWIPPVNPFTPSTPTQYQVPSVQQQRNIPWKWIAIGVGAAALLFVVTR